MVIYVKKIFIILIIFLIIIPINVFAFNDTSKSSVVMDIDSGRILYQKNMNEKSLIASITKIMTATIALEKGNLDDIYQVGNEVLEMYGTNIYLEVGEKISLKDLLYGLILRSGNDAAVVIANNISDNEEEFVKLMNKKAKILGMNKTVFSNSHGLDEKTKNYSTAHDMAILSSYIYKKSKLYRKINSTYKYELQSNNKSYLWYNRNKFLKMYKYSTGGKTGYTPSAGKTLVSTAKKDNLRITTVTLKDSNHYENHINIDNYIFDKYKNYLIVDKNNFKLNLSTSDKVYIKKSFRYPLTEEEKEEIKTIVKITKLSDYSNNQKIGSIDIFLNNEKIGHRSIFVKKNK